VIVFRLDRKKRKSNVLTGIGAERLGGRWNMQGTRTVYTSASRALAMLEVLVHVSVQDTLPADMIIAEIDIPNSVKVKELKKLPEGWNEYPYRFYVQKVFTDFCNNDEGAVLKVPSAIVQGEHNYLLNPLHKDFSKIKVVKIQDLTFDGRLSSS